MLSCGGTCGIRVSQKVGGGPPRWPHEQLRWGPATLQKSHQSLNENPLPCFFLSQKFAIKRIKFPNQCGVWFLSGNLMRSKAVGKASLGLCVNPLAVVIESAGVPVGALVSGVSLGAAPLLMSGVAGLSAMCQLNMSSHVLCACSPWLWTPVILKVTCSVLFTSLFCR